ncbi:MAG TPA: hypothetical protein VMZ26_12585, partial [Pyrinomonadaceae bacterium]|nr:hypothetical protein [Pyrinomonadaceae bacterium]
LPPQIADAVVKEAANPKLVEARVGAPKTTRITFIKAMTELLEDKPDAWISTTSEVADGERDMVVVLTEADLPLIRKVRRAFAANATPHSPDWYSSFTQIINTIQAMAKNKKASN